MYCFCCGRHSDDCPGGVWRGDISGRPREYRDRREGICIYCARAAIRAFGETPDAAPAQVVSIVSRITPDGPEAA